MDRWKKIAVTVGALIAGTVAVLTFIGGAIYEAADVEGNVSSIGSFLRRLHDGGQVNLGAVLLVILGLFGVGALIMAIWKLGPFKLARGSGAAPDRTKQGPISMARSLTSPLSVGAVGIFREIAIQQIKPGSTLQFKCRCEVEFYGISAGKCSPGELRLTDRGGGHTLANLEGARVSACPGAMIYEGVGDWSELMKTAATAWGRSEFKGPVPHDQNPPPQNLYCDVELRIPPGDSGVRHDESTVRLESEFGKNGVQAITIKINTWASFESPSTTITPL